MMDIKLSIKTSSLPMVFMCCLVILGYSFTGFAQNDQKQPNIILINVDDLGWTDLACYGSRYYETPNIDKLAAEGMLFTNAYAAAAVCSPTRSAIMTGKAPARTGITDWIRARFQGGTIPADKTYTLEYVGDSTNRLLTPANPLWMELEEVTIAERLQRKGYATAHIGKWHLGTEDWYPEEQGFDKNIGGCDYGQPPSYFDPYYNSERMPGIPTLPPRKEGEYLEDRLADEAVSFIKAHQNQPFFMYMCNYAVHTPIQGRPDLVAKYEQKDTTNQKSPDYAAMVESVDLSVGKMMQTLKDLGKDENTLIIFTSDNGGLEVEIATDNDPLRSGKGYPYEGGIRVPMIVRWAGQISAGSQNETPVISHDLYPTICEIAGLEVPKPELIDGVSLVPVLLKKQKLDRKTLYWHFPHYRQKDIVPYSIIRDGDWKLIKRYEGTTYELYNLANDLSEREDLSQTKIKKVRELDQKLLKWLEKVDARMPKQNPRYVSME
ncbi:sulfatase [Catalinimonas sp. 4WD22]|uniref:sulfatase n=1 Tax=Catalinimonas locisalis TaxID=3133978 RepID=UPI003101A581